MKIDIQKLKISWHKVKNLLLELFIVFLGVFLAFQLNNYKEKITSNELKNNYYHLILHEFQANYEEISYVRKNLEEYVEKLKLGIQNKETPKIETLNSVDLENNMLVLKSAFQNGHLENINPEYITHLSLGSNSFTRVAKLVDRYKRGIDNVLIENDWNNDLFYDKDKNLKDQYSWIIEDLDFITGNLIGLEKAFEEGAIPDTRELIGDE